MNLKIKRFFTLSANIAGRLHLQQGGVCEDVIVSDDNSKYQIIVLCDGVSSVKYGLEGAKLIANKALFFLATHQLSDFNSIDEFKYQLMQSIFELIQSKASEYQCKPEDFAATLCFAKNTKDEQIIGQLGDSQAFAFNQQNDIFHIPLKKSEYANYTHHAAKSNAHEYLEVHSFKKNTYKYFMLCSDGAAHSLVSNKSTVTFSNAVDVIIKGLSTYTKEYLEEQMNKNLMPMLQSKTHDDCALAFLGLCELNISQEADFEENSPIYQKLLECLCFTTQKDVELLKLKAKLLSHIFKLKKQKIEPTYQQVILNEKFPSKMRYHFAKLSSIIFIE
jgi:serine/threonine protein phosphatase PrpC